MYENKLIEMDEIRKREFQQEQQQLRDEKEQLQKQYETSEIKRAEIEKKMKQLRRGVNTTA